MAKATQKKKTQAVATRQQDAPAVTDENLPEYLRGYKGPTGTENIDQEDITIPRLKIGQSMSDEVKEGRVAEGALFLNVTGESLWSPGDPPLTAVIVALSKEYILWRPREDGGGILARAKRIMVNGRNRYQWDKQNQKFDVKVGGKVKATWKTARYVDENDIAEWGSEIPGNSDSGIAATAHHNYVVVLPGNDNIIAAISMTRSGVKKAKDWNTAIKMRGNAPLHASLWTIETVDDSNDNGDEYKNWRIKPAGWVNEDDLKKYNALAEGFKESGINVDLSDAEAAGEGASDDDEM